MNELITKNNKITETKTIKNMIYEIRGKQVMLDSDLAKLYQCKNGTKEINQAVKNNPKKFPERFSWKLTNKEKKDLQSKFLTANINSKSRSNPRVFTEQGIAMLATILHTKIATEISIRIMDAFILMRHYISNSLIEQKFINNLVFEHDNKIKLLEDTFDQFKINNSTIFFEGQIFDAYSKILDIFKLAKKSLIIIDNYADYNTLNLIKKININVTIITSNNKYITKENIDKYNKEYHNLKIIYNKSFHDRYFILDDNDIFFCGSSINNIGNKTSSIILCSDNDIKIALLNKIKEIKNIPIQK